MAVGSVTQTELGHLGGFFAAGQSSLLVEAATVEDVSFYYLGTPVTIRPEGYEVRFCWAPVAGATSAEVDAAGLCIAASTTQRSLGELKAEASGNHYVITSGDKRIY